MELTAETDADTLASLLPDGKIISQEPGLCTLQMVVPRGQEDDLCRKIFHTLSRANVVILRLNVSKPTLEDIFLELTADKKEEL